MMRKLSMTYLLMMAVAGISARRLKPSRFLFAFLELHTGHFAMAITPLQI
jgi:hypothetical protein